MQQRVIGGFTILVVVAMFLSSCRAPAELRAEYTMEPGADPSGAWVVQLWETREGLIRAAWSPDSQRLAYIQYEGGGTVLDLYTLVDEKITELGYSAWAGPGAPSQTELMALTGLCWSGSGTRFIASLNGVDVILADADKRILVDRRTLIWDLRDPSQIGFHSFQTSPSGDYALFLQGAGGKAGVWTVGFYWFNLEKTFDPRGAVTDLTWRSDGKAYAFRVTDGPRTGLYIANLGYAPRCLVAGATGSVVDWTGEGIILETGTGYQVVTGDGQIREATWSPPPAVCPNGPAISLNHSRSRVRLVGASLPASQRQYWSQDGKKAVLELEDEVGNSAVWLVSFPQPVWPEGNRIPEALDSYRRERPFTVTASSVARDGYAELAFDGLMTTAWRPAVRNGRLPGVGESLTLKFESPQVVTGISLVTGAGSSQSAFRHYARLAAVEVETSDGRKCRITFADNPGVHRIQFPPVTVEWVKLTIVGIYPGPVAEIGIAEIEIHTETK